VATAGLDNFAGGTDKSAALAAGVSMGRLGHVDEIADVIKFLTSDQARFVTGAIVPVNGGKTAL
jgi:NAD(P)-dependent dehydrogenase (short-subunit alcohol dehydrogenase family)